MSLTHGALLQGPIRLYNLLRIVASSAVVLNAHNSIGPKVLVSNCVFMPSFVANCAKKVAPPSRGPCTRVFKAIRAVSDKPNIFVDFSMACSGPASIIKIEVANSTITESKSSNDCEINAICTFHFRPSRISNNHLITHRTRFRSTMEFIIYNTFRIFTNFSNTCSMIFTISVGHIA